MWKWFVTGADPGFQVGGRGAHKKIAPSGGKREHFWDISCEKSRFYGGGAFPISRSIELFLSLFVIRGNGPNEYQMIYFN